MPLLWICSSLMILFLLLVFTNFYYVKLEESLDLSLSMVCKKDYMIKW